MTTHTGSCHCGKVAFTVEGGIDGALACNCSICQRKGSLLWFVPRGQLDVTAGEDTLVDYTFNKHAIRHRFCPVCGIHPFAEGENPDGGRVAAINLRCIDGIDLDAIPVTHFDGRAL